MTAKNKIYLGLSIVVFFITLFSILSSSESVGVLNDSLSYHWILLFIATMVLLIFNTAEIIINRIDWNTFYWLGVVFNVLTIIFMMRYFKLELF